MYPLMKTSAAVIFWIIYASQGIAQGAIQRSFDIFNGKVISDTVFSTTIVSSACQCKSRCFTVPHCTAFSIADVSGEKECKLADGFPSVTAQEDAVFGVVSHGAPNYTPAPPTTIDPTTYELRFEEDEECSPKRTISAVSMTPLDPNHSHPKYTVCWKAKTGAAFELDTSSQEFVATGPKDTPAECTGNRVFVNFVGYSDATYNTVQGRNNPPYMKGTCQLLLNWVVDYNDCEVVTPVTTAWHLELNTDTLTPQWDYWMSCSPFYLAIMLTRELNGYQNEVTSMKCCRIN